MSDPSLSRPPFTPPGTFLCCICFALIKEQDAFEDENGKWDMCYHCGREQANYKIGYERGWNDAIQAIRGIVDVAEGTNIENINCD